MKIHSLFVYLLVLASSAYESPQPSRPPDRRGDTACSSVICPGEELVYDVSWLKIPLGQIRLKTSPSTLVEGRIQHNACAYVDSYSGLPFVDLHAIDQTQMDEAFFSRGFNAVEKKGDVWQSEKSHYDVQRKVLVIEKRTQKGKDSPPISQPTYDTLSLSVLPIQDGLSILFYARANIRSARDIRVPTVVYGKQGTTHFHFQVKKEYEEIDAWKDRKISVIPLEGKAEFEGMFGFTGDFKGWFSDDAAAIPVKAELSVLVGSVTVELVKWKRDGWVPPQ